MKYSLPKGTFDLLPESDEPWKEIHRWHYLEKIMRELAHQYGYQEIRTPIFEKTDLFLRSVGETSDIISKEMYIFEDKGGRSMSLRPEGTAAVMRAFIEKHLHHKRSVTKLFYIGPFFRYDRPQAGRFRQFHQFGIEAIGDPTPECDFEVIDMTHQLFERLGLKNLTVLINSIGSPEERENYIRDLRSYLEPHYDSLSSDSKVRLEKNPLRILDTKDPKEIQLLDNIPHMVDYLTDKSKAHFSAVCELLNRHGIKYKIDHRLVRGLDYYTHTVFEVTSDVLGAQSTLSAGGRFNNLVEDMGGPATSACGFAMGIERILQTMLAQEAHFDAPTHPTVLFIPLNEGAKKACFDLCSKLRHERIAAEVSLYSKLNKGLKQASDKNATFAAILGEDELEKGVIQIKHLASRDAKEVSNDNLINLLREYDV